MSYERYYPNGWQSGEAGGTPITPEALNHMEEGIMNSLPATESAAYPGCYYRTVDGVEEWLNPPMELGVEYRTTERFGGSAVYRKIVTYMTTTTIGGNSVTTIYVPHGISNLATPISCNAKYEDYPFLPYIGHNNFASVVGFRTSDIVLSILNDTWVAGTWCFDLKYTKTRD